MTLALISWALVAVTAYIWSLRGFFSALVHLICVVIAGAVAFGVWEWLGYFILDNAPTTGWLRFLGDTAWAIALAGPFAVTLVVLRLAVDSMLPSNAQCDSAVDYVGGAVCGVASGVVAVGILVLSFGCLRLGADGFFAYPALEYGDRGNLIRAKSPMVPWVDRIASGLYSRLSLTSFRTPEPLAKWHPALDTAPAGMRMSFTETGRNTINPRDFEVLMSYSVGDPQKDQAITPLVGTQEIADLSGEKITRGYLSGFVVRFKPGAKEKASGQVVVGNGQVRLVAANADDTDFVARHPIAIFTNEEIEVRSGTQVQTEVNPEASNRISFARFKFEQSDTFIASVGGAAEAMMAFEFPLPPGYRPIALYIRGSRYDVPPPPTDPKRAPPAFGNPPSRDAYLRAALARVQGGGSLGGAGGETPTPPGGMKTYDALKIETRQIGSNPQAIETGLNITPAIGFSIRKGSERFDVEQDPNPKRGWLMVNGEQTFRADELSNVGVDFSLRIDRFMTTPDVVIVKVKAGVDQKCSLLSKVFQKADRAEAPVLVDSAGKVYQAIGYVSRDNSSQLTKIRYTPGSPIESLKQLEEAGVYPSTSKPTQTIELIYRVDNGAMLQYFGIADMASVWWTPGVAAARTGR